MQRLVRVSNQLRLQKQFSTSINSGPILVNPINENFLRVIMNQPKALNSLNLEMVRILQQQVQLWNKQDSGIKAIWLEGAGEKAFCAGGDIKSLYEAKVSGNQEAQQVLEDFFRQEFELDYALSQMSPIQISVMDGIVMGGGVGVSIHSPIRIATEHSVFAMPEAKIGFFTDVGGGYFLSNIRNNIGYYLGLSGARLKGKQLVSAGVADYFIPRERLSELQNTLQSKVNQEFTLLDANSIVESYSENIEKHIEHEEEINQLFTTNEFSDLYKNFESNQTEFSQKLWKTIQSQNPLSLRVIYEQISNVKKNNLSLRDAFITDYRLSQRFMQGTDFFEGVRTVLVDRNDTPKFSYKDALEVPESEVQRYFSPLEDIKELEI